MTAFALHHGHHHPTLAGSAGRFVAWRERPPSPAFADGARFSTVRRLNTW